MTDIENVTALDALRPGASSRLTALTLYERLMVASTDHAPRGPVLGVRLASGEFLPDPELTEAIRILREAWLAAGEARCGALPAEMQRLITAAGTVSECAVSALAPGDEAP